MNKVDKILNQFKKTISALDAEANRLNENGTRLAELSKKLEADSKILGEEADRATKIAGNLATLLET